MNALRVSMPVTPSSTPTTCGDANQSSQEQSAAVTTGSQSPTPNVTPLHIRGGSPSSGSMIRGGSEHWKPGVPYAMPAKPAALENESCSPDKAIASDLRSTASTAPSTDISISSDARSVEDLLVDDPEFRKIRVNSLMVNRLPEEIITIGGMDDESVSSGELGDLEIDEIVEDLYGNIREVKMSKEAMESTSDTDYQAHMDGGSQVSTTNDLSVLWGYKPFSKKFPCKIKIR